MSSLARYKKSGGFFQLLSLIETFGPQKKEKFLEMIDQESHVWAKALRDKMLTLERIFQWPDQTVIEVFRRLPVKGQAFAMQGLKDEYKAKIMPLISTSEQRRMNDVLTESAPKPEEIQATLVKVVEVARRLLVDRELNAEKFDEGLIIPEAFESKLEEMGAAALANEATEEAEAPMLVFDRPNNHVKPNDKDHAHHGPEVAQLQKALSQFARENKTLKEEVKILRDKLEAIRKIA